MMTKEQEQAQKEWAKRTADKYIGRNGGKPRKGVVTSGRAEWTDFPPWEQVLDDYDYEIIERWKGLRR
jgi:hypothetical protein